MRPTPAVGYWGEKTANTNWCESDYVVTEYVAEFFNSLSSWFIVGNGVFGCIAHKRFAEPKFLLCFVLLCVVGVGSCAFHATLWSSMQSLDELPMVWLNSAFFYVLATTEEPRSARGGGSTLLPDRPLAAFGLFLFTVCETAAILIFDTTDQVVFLLCYGGGVAVLIPLTARFNSRFNPDGRANLMELSLVICASRRCTVTPLRHNVLLLRRYLSLHNHYRYPVTLDGTLPRHLRRRLVYTTYTHVPFPVQTSQAIRSDARTKSLFCAAHQ